jgi:prevent-host-death family protein
VVSADSFRNSLGHWLDRVAAGEDAVVTRRGKPMIRLSPAAPLPRDRLIEA